MGEDARRAPDYMSFDAGRYFRPAEDRLSLMAENLPSP